MEYDLFIVVNLYGCGSEGIAVHSLSQSLPIEIREPDAQLGKMCASRTSGGSCGIFSWDVCADCRVEASGSRTEMLELATCF